MKASPVYLNVDLIAIVDPRPIFKRGLRQILSQTRKSLEVIEASSCQELERKYAEYAPEIIFFSGAGHSDLQIIDLASCLRRYSPLAGIAVYDNRPSLDFLITFFQDSIGGYLPEDFDERDLDMCINSLAAGLHYVNSEVAYRLITHKMPSQKQPRTTTLSGLERKVAAFLIRGMTTSEIAHTLDRRSSTISTVKSNIYRKTNVHNIIDLATTLKKRGTPLEIPGEA
ncbi:DNA-binding response regulator, NarL/FixJ family, contains REC and HTH domains [Dyadobacter soli]|uniref:DNA-binding response regulator, NarL/FixJ family, contains REC and HTH domains n=1 Tax=Dyadobacter soli TaxID=659014 RepID=A0A1G7T516_9BACT|nr:response regulator transcription factor [Dyadobacter soli]SDG29739.1 DNA-binding response regulator, NarL/FixJ family, contains REC and HTH domains [Dyadobacter soli]